MSISISRPGALLPEHLIYLDELRRSGAVNMFGAAPYLIEAFPELNSKTAKEIFIYWMKTFSERHP